MPSSADKDVFRRLEETFRECSSDGWDGGKTKRISEEVLRNAAAFVESLPPGVEPTDTGAEADGAMSIEWYRSTGRVISVSVNPGGEIFYAAIVNGRRIHGRDSSSPGVSDDLLELIAEVASITPPGEQS